MSGFPLAMAVGIDAIGKRNAGHTITLSAILLEPTNNAKKIAFFSLGILDLVFEGVDLGGRDGL